MRFFSIFLKQTLFFNTLCHAYNMLSNIIIRLTFITLKEKRNASFKLLQCFSFFDLLIAAGSINKKKETQASFFKHLFWISVRKSNNSAARCCRRIECYHLYFKMFQKFPKTMIFYILSLKLFCNRASYVRTLRW